jgi:hypothetical protein
MVLVRHEGRVLGMVRRKELRPLREKPEAVDVPERPAQRQRREQGEDGDTDETRSHGAKVYAGRPPDAYFAEAIPR